MIFDNLSVIIQINIALLIFLLFTLIYLYILIIYERLRNRLKTRLFNEWHEELHEAIIANDSFRINVARHITWFNEFIIPYFLNFKGEITDQLRRIYRETGLYDYVMQHIDSRDVEKRVHALLSVLYAHTGITVDLREKLVSHIHDDFSLSTILVFKIIARHWPEDHGITLIKRMNETEFFSENVTHEIASEMSEFIKSRYLEIFEHFKNDQATRLFMIDIAGILQVEKAIPILSSYFQKQDSEEFIRSMKALTKLDYIHVKDDLKLLFTSDSSSIIKSLAFKSFLRLSDENDVHYIEEQLKSQNWFVRYAAAKKLARLGERGVKALYYHAEIDSAALALAEFGMTLEKKNDLDSF